MPFKKGDIVGKTTDGDASVGIVETVEQGDKYQVYFYTAPGVGEAGGYDGSELVRRNTPFYMDKYHNILNVDPRGGSRKSRRRSRKNKRTRSVRR